MGCGSFSSTGSRLLGSIRVYLRGHWAPARRRCIMYKGACRRRGSRVSSPRQHVRVGPVRGGDQPAIPCFRGGVAVCPPVTTCPGPDGCLVQRASATASATQAWAGARPPRARAPRRGP
jgi:hypothetical protein